MTWYGQKVQHGQPSSESGAVSSASQLYHILEQLEMAGAYSIDLLRTVVPGDEFLSLD